MRKVLVFVGLLALPLLVAAPEPVESACSLAGASG